MPYVIAEPCIGTKDASCVEVCPVDCIYEAEDQYYINPDECIDCGACEPECPVQAIFPDTDVPPEWTTYIEKNRTLSDKCAAASSRIAGRPRGMTLRGSLPSSLTEVSRTPRCHPEA